MTLTVDDFQNRVSLLTSLSDEAASDERALIDGFLNEGIAKTFEKTQCVITKVNVTLAAGVDEYALDRGVLTVLEYGQSDSAPSARLTALNAKEIIERKFLASQGTVRYFAVLGGNLLIVSPIPVDDQVIHFWAVPVPDPVSGSMDIFDTGLPTYAQRAVECYVYARCWEVNRDFKQSAFWDNEFEKECGAIRVTMRRQAGRTLPALKIGYPDRESIPSRNDTYPSGRDY